MPQVAEEEVRRACGEDVHEVILPAQHFEGSILPLLQQRRARRARHGPLSLRRLEVWSRLRILTCRDPIVRLLLCPRNMPSAPSWYTVAGLWEIERKALNLPKAKKAPGDAPEHESEDDRAQSDDGELVLEEQPALRGTGAETPT